MALGTPAIPNTGGGATSDVNLVEVGGAPIQLGQQIDGESIPVVLPADQITALTPIGNITNYALETGGNLASIKSNTDKIPSLGQALAAGSVPVVLTALQLAALAPLSTVAVTQSTSPWVTQESALTSLGSFQTTVTTAGTRIQLTTNTSKSVTVKAKATNTGLIYVGTSTVSSSNGLILSAGDAVSLDISNTNLIYIDSSVNAEGISVIYAN